MTSRSDCATAEIRLSRSPGGQRLAMRCMVSATSLAWIVVVSTWPEIAAWIAASIVSLSRHSPTMMSVGSRRMRRG